MILICARILVRFVISMAYCLLVGGALASVIKKSYLISLAPAFVIQSLVMVFSGMLVHSVFVGAYLMMALSVILLTCKSVAACRSEGSIGAGLGSLARRIYPKGEVIVFLIAFVLVWGLNFGKYLDFFDEHSHWGMFVKEIIHLDALYCTSPLDYVPHRDYPPGVSVFEALWCRLMGAASDDNMYRGIQMLEVSMMLPAAYYVAPGTNKKSFIPRVLWGLVLFATPILTSEPFYHSIVTDMFLGVMIFYCMWVVITQQPSAATTVMLGASMMFLPQIKVTALPFVLMILIYYVVYRRDGFRSVIVHGGIMVLVSVAFWRMTNKYVFKSLEETGGDVFYGQSLKKVNVKKIIKYFFHVNPDEYQSRFDRIYLSGLTFKKTYADLSYVGAVLLATVALLIWFKIVVKDREVDKTIRLTALWIFLAGIAYVILMYLAYMMTFGHEYALTLPSFDRYMSSFVLAAMLLSEALVIYFSKHFLKWSSVVPAVILAALLIAGIRYDAIDQLFPGNIALGRLVRVDDNRYDYDCMLLDRGVPDEESVYVIARGNTSDDVTGISFYEHPKYVTGGSPGPDVDDEDERSRDVSPEELKETLSRFHYMYLRWVDEKFLDKYSGIFSHPETLECYVVYKIDAVDGIIDNQVVCK